MPEVTTIEKDGRLRHIFALQPGERVKICRCYSSKGFPFCDGTHNHIHTHAAPAIVEVLKCESNTKEANPGIPV